MTPQTQNSGNAGFEVPQLALGRYLELLQRRWWHVIPVSLIGLTIGALIASSVPRYYKVFTKIQYSGSPFDRVVGTATDPMADEFRSLASRIKSPDLIRKTMRDLGWPEASDPDLEAVRAAVDEVAGEIVVDDLNRKEKSRTFFEAAIRFRDLDGDRAESFVNKLTENWRDGRIESLERQAGKKQEEITANLTAAQTERDVASTQIVQLQQEHGLDLSARADARAGGLSPELRERDRLEGQISQLETNRDKKVSELRDLQREINLMPRMVDKDADPEEAKKEDPFADAKANAAAAYAALVVMFKGMTELHPDYNQTAGRVAAAKAIAQELGVVIGPSGAIQPEAANAEQVRNTAYDEAKREERAIEREIESLESQIERSNELLAAVKVRLKLLPDVLQELREWQTKFNRAVENIDRFLARRTELTSDIASLQTSAIIEVNRAFAPPAPTDPSILFLAMFGAILGLGAAIALILVWDLLQSTFKTVEDVERGLPIPVLGTMAHLETTEERVQASNTRRRVSLTAAGFLFLMVSVVTVYYIAPTRLPPFVIEVFDLLLGAPAP